MAANQLTPEQKTRYAERAARYRLANLEECRERSRASQKKRLAQRRIQSIAWRKTKTGQESTQAYRKRLQTEGTGQWSTDPAKRVRLLASHARVRAKRRGLEIDNGFLLSLAAPAECPSCHLLIDYTFEKKRDTGRSPSLDRFDNAKGYICGNVRVICNRCNMVKGKATLAELEAVVAYMRS